jgi:hypothetical protein
MEKRKHLAFSIANVESRMEINLGNSVGILRMRLQVAH